MLTVKHKYSARGAFFNHEAQKVFGSTQYTRHDLRSSEALVGPQVGENVDRGDCLQVSGPEKLNDGTNGVSKQASDVHL